MADVSATHWGFTHVTAKAGRVEATNPFVRDRNPSPLIGGLPEAIHAPTSHPIEGGPGGVRD